MTTWPRYPQTPSPTRILGSRVRWLFDCDAFMGQVMGIAHEGSRNHTADLTMARMAALSGSGSFAQAVTTWDKSGPHGTGICESLCESPIPL